MSEWDQRELCPDGACVGVIGVDGTCTVCGRAGSGPKKPALKSVELVAPPPETKPSPTPSASDDDFDNRQLCPDGACIGVIGADGVCTVCGRAAAS